MKKLLLFVLLAFGVVLNVAAQLVVLENGQTQLGNPISGVPITPNATLNIWSCSNGSGSLTGSGIISFGRGSDATIGGNGFSGSLTLTAKNYFTLKVADNVSGIYFNSNSKLFRFGYNIQAPSFLTASDARYKKNVSSLIGTSSKLMDLNPVSYKLSYPVRVDSAELAQKASLATESPMDDRLHYGFIAQEIQKIYPNLVVEDEDGMLAIDYTGFIPILVDAYQNLTNKVKEAGRVYSRYFNGDKSIANASIYSQSF